MTNYDHQFLSAFELASKVCAAGLQIIVLIV